MLICDNLFEEVLVALARRGFTKLKIINRYAIYYG